MLLRDLRAHLAVLEAGGDLDRPIRSITRDSREAGVGALFVAIAGSRYDGHEAIAHLPPDIAGVLVQRPIELPRGLPWLRVADTREGLAQASAAWFGHPAAQVPVIGVTGTNGKTTITTLIQQAIQATGGIAGRIGTTGVQVGARQIPSPLTTPEAPVLHGWFREMVDEGACVIAMEVSSIGLVQRRVDAIAFHTAVFTNLGHDHLDFHGTFEAYAEAKSTLFTRHLRAPGGMPRALLCGDDPRHGLMGAPVDQLLYGFEAGHDVHIAEARLGGGGMELVVEHPWGRHDLRSPLVGRFNALNLVAAFGAGVMAGIAPDRMAEGLVHASGAPGRLEPIANDAGLTVLVDYAHTPDALQAAITSVRAAIPGALWVVFGCGGDRDRAKRPLMGRAAELADHVVLTSDNPRSEDPRAILDDVLGGMVRAPDRVFVDRREALTWALSEARAGDAVLVAGKGHETTQEIAGIFHPFDDRRVIAEILSKREGSDAVE